MKLYEKGDKIGHQIFQAKYGRPKISITGQCCCWRPIVQLKTIGKGEVGEDKGGREVPRDNVKGNTIPSQVLNDGVDGDDDLKEDKNIVTGETSQDITSFSIITAFAIITSFTIINFFMAGQLFISRQICMAR